jgi:hypothetical protein
MIVVVINLRSWPQITLFLIAKAYFLPEREQEDYLKFNREVQLVITILSPSVVEYQYLEHLIFCGPT